MNEIKLSLNFENLRSNALHMNCESRNINNEMIGKPMDQYTKKAVCTNRRVRFYCISLRRRMSRGGGEREGGAMGGLKLERKLQSERVKEHWLVHVCVKRASIH
jgi:hypothetical protein